MTNFDIMLDYLTEACATALGEEWERMSDKEKHDTIMAFLATSAAEAAKA